MRILSLLCDWRRKLRRQSSPPVDPVQAKVRNLIDIWQRGEEPGPDDMMNTPEQQAAMLNWLADRWEEAQAERCPCCGGTGYLSPPERRWEGRSVGRLGVITDPEEL